MDGNYVEVDRKMVINLDGCFVVGDIVGVFY